MNIGLIGCGRVSETHMCAYRNLPEANVVAVSDINLKRAKAFAQRHRIEKAYEDYFQLFEMKGLDYVDVCTPTSTHATIACDAANTGHNILLEKPMARNTLECDNIIHEISKHRVKLSICHNQLFLPQVMRAKTLVSSAEFPLAYFRILVRESADLIGAPNWIMTSEHGGALWETGTHAAYLQLHFLQNINEVSAMGEKIEHQVPDFFIVLLSSPSKTIGVIEVSWLARKKTEVMFELISTEGKQIQIQNYSHLLEIPQYRPSRFLQGFYWDQKLVTNKWAKFLIDNLHYRNVLNCLPHYILFDEYIKSIQNDSEPPVKPEEGRNTVRLLECIEESLNLNRPVSVKN